MSKITTTHRRCNWKSSKARGTVAHFQGSMLKAEREKNSLGRRKSKPTLSQGKFSKRVETGQPDLTAKPPSRTNGQREQQSRKPASLILCTTTGARTGWAPNAKTGRRHGCPPLT